MARADLSAHATSAGSNPVWRRERERADAFAGGVRRERDWPPWGLQRAESIADISRFQIGGAGDDGSVDGSIHGPVSAQPGHDPAAVRAGRRAGLAVTSRAGRSAPRGVFGGRVGLHRAHSVADFDPTAGAGGASSGG